MQSTSPAQTITERDASHYIGLSIAYLRQARRLGRGPRLPPTRARHSLSHRGLGDVAVGASGHDQGVSRLVTTIEACALLVELTVQLRDERALVASLQADVQSYRLLAQQSLHALHDPHDRARSTPRTAPSFTR
jgi:hypothetical protein